MPTEQKTNPAVERLESLIAQKMITKPYDFYDLVGATVIKNEHYESRRWVEVYEMIVKLLVDGEEHYAAVIYDEPSTEMQEGSESEASDWTIYAVKPEQFVTTRYVLL